MSTSATVEPVRETQGTGDEQKWFNSPVTFCEGSLSEIRQHVPSFERRRFGLTQPNERWSRLNKRLDTIVRQPFGEDQTYVPIGVVSSEYSLLPHTAFWMLQEKCWPPTTFHSTLLKSNSDFRSTASE